MHLLIFSCFVSVSLSFAIDLGFGWMKWCWWSTLGRKYICVAFSIDLMESLQKFGELPMDNYKEKLPVENEQQ